MREKMLDLPDIRDVFEKKDIAFSINMLSTKKKSDV